VTQVEKGKIKIWKNYLGGGGGMWGCQIKFAKSKISLKRKRLTDTSILLDKSRFICQYFH